jgi:hypothetical protein
MRVRSGVIALWIVALLGAVGLAHLVGVVGGPSSHPPPLGAPSSAPTSSLSYPPNKNWTVVHQLSAHNILVVEVETARLDEAGAIAQQLTEPVKDRYSEILVYLYRPGTHGQLAARRVQWTPTTGYVVVDYERLARGRRE